MDAHDVIPTVMVRNEERFIGQVLRPLAQVFGRVLLGDTGSTDDTLGIAAQIPGVRIIEYTPRPHTLLTEVRQDLGLRAYDMGARWQLLCDGDELYTVTTLAWLLAHEPPPWMRIGYTAMRTIDEDAAGQTWELADQFNRTALLESDVRWSGEYPFDAPVSFGKPEGFYYYELPPGYRYHAVHLHPLVRSRQDDVVALRTFKRPRFSMQERTVPRERPFDLTAWCAQ